MDDMKTATPSFIDNFKPIATSEQQNPYSIQSTGIVSSSSGTVGGIVAAAATISDVADQTS